MLISTNTCGQTYSFSIDPGTSELHVLGAGDLHDSIFDRWVRTVSNDDFKARNGLPGGVHRSEPFCSYLFDVYPTAAMERSYLTKNPIMYGTVTGFAFFVTCVLFLAFDFFVRRRQNKVMASAKRTSGIVSSLFPESVRSRLYDHVIGASPDAVEQRGQMETEEKAGTSSEVTQ
jgi:hypothetical protein